MKARFEISKRIIILALILTICSGCRFAVYEPIDNYELKKQLLKNED
ncbi:hypothetical protein LCGC14_0820410 [marine sediment metagenome]|uniref:Lipoprotein n=1 Tax=marine sediment metagenome TaxID=412755 RepID=A0A0F9SRN1_9ZZZZ